MTLARTGWGGEHIMGQDMGPAWELQVQRAGGQPHGHLHLMTGLETHLPQGPAGAADPWQRVCVLVCAHVLVSLPRGGDALRPLVGSPQSLSLESMAFAVNGPLTRARSPCVEEDTVFRP